MYKMCNIIHAWSLHKMYMYIQRHVYMYVIKGLVGDILFWTWYNKLSLLESRCRIFFELQLGGIYMYVLPQRHTCTYNLHVCIHVCIPCCNEGKIL